MEPDISSAKQMLIFPSHAVGLSDIEGRPLGRADETTLGCEDGIGAG